MKTLYPLLCIGFGLRNLFCTLLKAFLPSWNLYLEAVWWRWVVLRNENSLALVWPGPDIHTNRWHIMLISLLAAVSWGSGPWCFPSETVMPAETMKLFLACLMQLAPAFYVLRQLVIIQSLLARSWLYGLISNHFYWCINTARLLSFSSYQPTRELLGVIRPTILWASSHSDWVLLFHQIFPIV